MEEVKHMDRCSNTEDMDSVLLSHGERLLALSVGQQSRCLLDPKEGHMSESTEQNVDQQETEVNPAPEQDNGTTEATEATEGSTPDAPTEPAEVAVEVGTEPEAIEPPTVEELILKDHKERVLGKDRISRNQMKSYIKFLTDKGEDFVEVMGTQDTNVWAAVAKRGKSAMPNGKDVDAKFVELWGEWKGEQPNPGDISGSHMWLKGVCAAALLIAMYNDEKKADEEHEALYAPELAPVVEQPAEEREQAEADAAAVVAEQENTEPESEGTEATEESNEGSEEDTTEGSEQA